MDWSTGGDAANILDRHEIALVTVVMPNAHWQAPPSPTRERAVFSDENLLDNVIPYVDSHYDVSKHAL